MTENYDDKQLYSQLLSYFLKDNQLALTDRGYPCIVKQFEITTSKKDLSNKIEQLDLNSIDFNNFHDQVIQYFLDNTNEQQKETVLKNQTEFFYPHHLVLKTMSNPNYLKSVIQGISTTNFWKNWSFTPL